MATTATKIPSEVRVGKLQVRVDGREVVLTGRAGPARLRYERTLVEGQDVSEFLEKFASDADLRAECRSQQ